MVTPQKIQLNVSIGGNNVDVFKYLGVYVDKHLKWEKLFAIGRLLLLPSKVTVKLYKSFILPIFDYCDVIWSPHLSRHINSFEKAHQRVIDDWGCKLLSTFIIL